MTKFNAIPPTYKKSRNMLATSLCVRCMVFVGCDFEGGCLHEKILAQKELFAEEVIIWYFYQLISAIAYIHSCDILHRSVSGCFLIIIIAVIIAIIIIIITIIIIIIIVMFVFNVDCWDAQLHILFSVT